MEKWKQYLLFEENKVSLLKIWLNNPKMLTLERKLLMFVCVRICPSVIKLSILIYLIVWSDNKVSFKSIDAGYVQYVPLCMYSWNNVFIFKFTNLSPHSARKVIPNVFVNTLNILTHFLPNQDFSLLSFLFVMSGFATAASVSISSVWMFCNSSSLSSVLLQLAFCDSLSENKKNLC